MFCSVSAFQLILFCHFHSLRCCLISSTGSIGHRILLTGCITVEQILMAAAGEWGRHFTSQHGRPSFQRLKKPSNIVGYRKSVNTNHKAVKHFIKYEISLDLMVWDEQHLETNSHLIEMSLQMKPLTSACLILIRLPMFSHHICQRD